MRVKASLGNSPKEGRKAGVEMRRWGSGTEVLARCERTVKKSFTWLSGRQHLFCRRS